MIKIIIFHYIIYPHFAQIKLTRTKGRMFVDLMQISTFAMLRDN